MTSISLIWRVRRKKWYLNKMSCELIINLISQNKTLVTANLSAWFLNSRVFCFRSNILTQERLQGYGKLLSYLRNSRPFSSPLTLKTRSSIFRTALSLWSNSSRLSHVPMVFYLWNSNLLVMSLSVGFTTYFLGLGGFLSSFLAETCYFRLEL